MSSSPAVSAEGVVFVGADDGLVYAFARDTGATLWTFTTGSLVQASPTLSHGAVFVGSYDNSVRRWASAGGQRSVRG